MQWPVVQSPSVLHPVMTMVPASEASVLVEEESLGEAPSVGVAASPAPPSPGAALSEPVPASPPDEEPPDEEPDEPP